MKRKKADEMVQTAVRLPQSLRDRLVKAGGESGMGEEIRRRLEASFDLERVPPNPKTRDLLDALSYFAEETAGDYGDWSADAFAFEVFKACADMLFMHYRPKGDAVANPKSGGMADVLFSPDHSLVEISRAYVRSWISDSAKRDEEKRR